MGKLAKKITRDSFTKTGRKVAIKSEEEDADQYREFQEVILSDDEDLPAGTVHFGKPRRSSNKQQVTPSHDKPLKSQTKATILNVDLLETVVRIIDYTEIPELQPIVGRRSRRITAKEKRKSKLRLQLDDQRTYGSTSSLGRVAPDIAKHDGRSLEEIDPDQQQFLTSSSLEMSILNNWWAAKSSDSKQELRRARATIAIGRKSFQIKAPKARKKKIEDRQSREETVVTFYEEDMNTKPLKIATRAAYRATIGANAFERIVKYLKMLLEHGTTSQYTRFTKFEFALMLLQHEFNLIQSAHLGYNFDRYGTGATMVAHTFVLFCIEMPFVMKIMTMASFSQTYVLRFFRAVPLLQGIGYVSLILYFILQTEVAQYFEGASRVLIFLLTTTAEWKDCPLTTEKYKCISFRNTSAHECIRSDVPFVEGKEYYSTQYFMNTVIFAQEEVELPWYISHGHIFIWILVLMVALNGISLIKKVTVRLQMWLALMPVVMSFGVLMYRIYSVYKGRIKDQYHNIPWSEVATFDVYQCPIPHWDYDPLAVIFQFIIDAITVGTKIHHLPFLIWVCAMMPEHASIEVYSTVTVFICILLTWSSASVYISCVEIISNTYNLSAECIHFEPRDHVFSLVPDMLLHISFAKSWLFFWFISILFYYAIYVVYAINVMVDTVAQCVPQMNKVSLIMTILVWSLICTCRYLRMNPIMEEIFEYFKPENFNIMGSILFGLLAFGLQFFYGQGRFQDDFLFYNNTAPKKMWAISWHIIVCVATIGLICGIINQCLHATNIDESKQVTSGMLELLIAAVALFIILYFFVRRSCYWLYTKDIEESFNPDPTWGSPDAKVVLLRKFYYSARDIRVRRRALVCNHRCMLGMYQYKHVRYAQIMKLSRITRKHKQ